MSYEAGKYYETERGGVVGPIKKCGASSPHAFYLVEKEKMSCNVWYADGSPGDFFTATDYGRLTTQDAAPSLGGKRGDRNVPEAGRLEGSDGG